MHIKLDIFLRYSLVKLLSSHHIPMGSNYFLIIINTLKTAIIMETVDDIAEES